MNLKPQDNVAVVEGHAQLDQSASSPQSGLKR